MPDRSLTVVPGGRPAASLYASVRSACAAAAIPPGSLAYNVPLISGFSAEQGDPSPRHDAVGLRPTSPLIVVCPAELELVSPAPATAANVDNDRKPTGG